MLFPVFVLLLNCFVATQAQAPANSFFKCDIYSAADTASATQNYQLCQIDNVCPGVKLVIGDCSSSCSGDQYIRLFDGDNVNQLAGNDDGACESPLNFCSRLEYSYPGSTCTSLTLRQGCFESNSCGGRIKVNYVYTASPTYAPSAVPTAVPTTSTPTTSPSVAVVLGANDAACLPYTASNTDNARSRYAVCNFQLCPGTVLTVGNCDGTCSGDQFLRLFDGSNNLVMYDDDGCENDPYSFCSQLTYVHRAGSCQTFSLHQGCYGDATCGGTMSIVKRTTPSPTVLPTAVPTAKPSAEPTTNPTAAPSRFPTPAPTLQPLTGFALTPITDVTSTAQTVRYRTKYVGVQHVFNDCSFNLANEADCEAAYPGAQIVTVTLNNRPVRYAVTEVYNAPTAVPTKVPTVVPTKVPSPVPSTPPTQPPYPYRMITAYGYGPQMPLIDGVNNNFATSYTCPQACSLTVYGNVNNAGLFYCSVSSTYISNSGYVQGGGTSGCTEQSHYFTGYTNNQYYWGWPNAFSFWVYDTKSSVTYGAASCMGLGRVNYCWVNA